MNVLKRLGSWLYRYLPWLFIPAPAIVLVLLMIWLRAA